jgi:hypothetical protein
MSNLLMLNGGTEHDNNAQINAELASLKARVEKLEAQQSRAKEEAVIALLNLFSQAMREIATGKFDLNVAPTGTGNSVTDRMDKWEAVKKRLSHGEGEVIDALLTCGPRTNTQLKTLLKKHYNTVAEITKKLSNLGFLTRVGEAWGLKD